MDVYAQLNYYFQHLVDGEKWSRQEAFVSINFAFARFSEMLYFIRNLESEETKKAHKST